MEVRLQTTLPAPWLTLPPMRIGQIPTGLGTPDVYALVQEEDELCLRIDLYASSSECFAFEEAIVWRNFIVIGYGSHVYLVETVSRQVFTYPLQDYFGHLYPAEQFLLVASSSHLLCLNKEGHLQWTSAQVGIDGVLVSDIEGDSIWGRGEWDPPGGWEPFQVNVHTGKQHAEPEPL